MEGRRKGRSKREGGKEGRNKRGKRGREKEGGEKEERERGRDPGGFRQVSPGGSAHVVSTIRESEERSPQIQGQPGHHSEFRVRLSN